MRLILSLLLAATVSSALAQTPAPPANVSLNNVSLNIEDSGGAYIPAASIEIDRPSESLHIATKSDSTGYFAIGLRPGTYDFTVKAQGFMTYRMPLTITAASAQQVRVQLRVGSCSPCIEVIPAAPDVAPIDRSLTSFIDTTEANRIEIKVVVINMFEVGADTGDGPGEYQYWVEREHLDKVLRFPAGYHDLRLNPETGVLGVLTGVGTARTAATIMAMGLDPRFDLTHAYFLVAGIGGIDPQRGSLASAVWPDWIVDGDLAHEIDAREIPKDWKTGYVPLGKSSPYEQPLAARFGDDGTVYHLNTTLVDWAFNLTKDTPLPDAPGIAARRRQYAEAAAQRPPFVLRGDDLSAATFWHGKLLNQWARDWVKYQTDGHATYAICGMEDSGTMQSLTWLAKANKIDIHRVLVLRTASNYDQQRPGITAADSLGETKIRQYSAYLPALDTAYRVGHLVVDNLVADWPQTRDHIPQK